MNTQLYQSLHQLRARIKEQEKITNGRAPLVCNDEALYAIAEMEPQKLSDLEGVPGIGKNFIENYGELFISVINGFNQETVKSTVGMDETATKTLRELEKKLISINRRNRLLYMPKMANKYAFDLLLETDAHPIDILFDASIKFTAADLSKANPAESKKYRNAVSLVREINKDLRDKGQNDLYIGYPFVIGRISGENFDIRCPLALFPVTASRTATKITISLDDSRDILYNNTLILAYYKFNKIDKPLPDAVIDNPNKGTFLRDLLNYYSENEIKIEMKNNMFTTFKEYKSSEFPQYNSDELYLENNIVLGKFPVCSSSIQNDFDRMIEEGQINNLLNELLLEVNDLDYESDVYYGEVEKKEDNPILDISEKNITYINDLDSSQENVLSAIAKLDKLVIQGPPGTGKSQVITSLIAKAVNENKNVLMVSEKKTALDVVYSRLGTLSKYALLIDDVGNKNSFYQQLDRIINSNTNYPSDAVEIDTLSNNIDNKVKLLEHVARNLFEVSDFGVETYKLYIQCPRFDLTDEKVSGQITSVYALLNEKISAIKYSELSSIHNRFRQEEFITQLQSYFDIRKNYDWIKYAKRNLTQIDLLNFASQYKQFIDLYNEYQSKSFFAKILDIFSVKKAANSFAKSFFVGSYSVITKILLKNPLEIKEGFERYAEYDGVATLYDSLNSNEKEYADVIFKIENKYESLLAANDGVYNVILYKNIIQFESLNADVLNTIGQYKNIVAELSDSIANKKRLTRDRLEAILGNDILNITNTKRTGEIRRIIEGKRKWSVNRFIGKYDFELFKGIKIWLLTPEVVSEIIPLQAGLFDLVIFDEASQMYIEKGLPSIQRAKKVIIAGDHKQLRPSSLGAGRFEIDEEDMPDDVEMTAALEEESLLDLARFKYQDVMLNFHYRSRYEELIAFSNYAFYKGRLYVSPNVDRPQKSPIEFHKMEDAIWVNRSNMVEAKYIVNMLKTIFEERVNEESIGIITFNSSQRDLIMDIIDEECAADAKFSACINAELNRTENGEDIGLFVKNIESVQGDERDIIIFSIGYAKNDQGRLIRNFGWLNQKGGENRLNVAISRAKQKIHVVTSFEPDELQVEDTKNDGPRIFKKYLQYSKAVSEGNTEVVQQILHSFGDADNSSDNISFDSDFENQVYDAINERLEDKGYSVDTQVGIGGYSIDLAIKKDGKYLMGIECDGKTYHSSKSARERDYHRQKYLESRGWRIHRIWSTNWWKNPIGEINKIVSIVETL